jgi:protein O-GlcNAc transferase
MAGMPTTDETMREAMGQAQAGRVPDAIATLRRGVGAAPDHPGLNGLLGTLLHATGRSTEAVACLERAHAAAPDNARIVYQLGALLVAGGQGRGVGLMRRALELEPGWVQAMNGLANALYTSGDFEGADELYGRSLATQPGQAEALCGRAGLYVASGRPQDAAALFREAARLHPANVDVLGRLVSALNYAEDARPEEAVDAHRRWGAAVAGGAGAVPVFQNAPAPERKLRVGFLSPDLYDHSCAYFLRPILRHRDPASYEAVAYSTSGRSDWMTAQLQGLVETWRDVAGVPGTRLVEMIRADGVDVLLELAGHTALGPLAALKDRAAPVQATYLGYPNTTGLPTMDWRIVDAVTDPPGAEAWHTERLARLEGCFVCYSPSEHAPGVARARAGGGRGTTDAWHPGWTGGGSTPGRGDITFGSFNSIRKLSPGVIRAWSRVLREIPGSRLLLKTRGLGLAFARRNILTQFAAHGIGTERVELAEIVPGKPDHLAWYQRVDVGLDTFPYNGTTTTCEALWMGVPVVTLRGRVHASRVGASLLTAAGMPELIAGSEDEYVAIAAGLARDAARLAALRGSMRERLGGSALMDSRGHSARFFGAVRAMWRDWCGGRR